LLITKLELVATRHLIIFIQILFPRFCVAYLLFSWLAWLNRLYRLQNLVKCLERSRSCRLEVIVEGLGLGNIWEGLVSFCFCLGRIDLVFINAVCTHWFLHILQTNQLAGNQLTNTPTKNLLGTKILKCVIEKSLTSMMYDVGNFMGWW